MPTPHSAYGAGSELALRTGGTLIRKTSLQDRTDDPPRSGKADKASRVILIGSHEMPGARTGRDPFDKTTIDTRNDLLFTI